MPRRRRHLIADISSKFVDVRASEVDREITDALRRICALLGIDVAVLWQWSGAHLEVIAPTHVHAREDLQPLGPLSQEFFPWSVQEMRHGRIVNVSSLDVMPAAAAIDRENCRRFGVRSNLTLPLAVAGEPPVGALSLNTVSGARAWPEALVKRLQLIAQVFTNALTRKRAEQALRESEERLSMAAEAASFGVWVWDIGRNQVWGSERWLKLFEFESGEKITFEMVIERIHPHDRETVERDVRRAVAERTDYMGEFRAIKGDSTQRWIVSRGRGYRDANGTPSRMVGAALDITEGKHAEEALRGLSRRLIKAHEEERTRVARDLHDDITQRLARLAIDAGQAEGSPDDQVWAQTMRSVREGLVSLSEDVHSLSYRLHPSVLEDLGLAEGLKAECERFSRQESIAIDMDVANTPAVIPAESALCLFRVAQEALRNVARHARARRVKVSVRALDDGLQLAVVDDGIGFEVAVQRDHPSLGLASMRERVHLLDGELDIESAPGKGTTVLVWIPVEKQG